MNYNDLQQAINFVEDHLDHIDYEDAAKCAYSSSFHFQRVFGLMCGITLGEYIRRRRLSLAGAELINGAKVIDVALKYGYQTPESFSRAFNKYHGILPSKVNSGTKLKYYSRLSLDFTHYGGDIMDCKIVEQEELVLVGFKKHFFGVPYGEERAKQENEFFCSTRAKQWLLIGASKTPDIDYGVVTNVSSTGYDYYVAYELDEWTRENLFNSEVTGVDLSQWGLKTIVIPRQTYVVFETDKIKYPIDIYSKLREQIMSRWLPTADYEFVSAPEVVAYHWRQGKRDEWAKERFIEIYLPVQLKVKEY